TPTVLTNTDLSSSISFDGFDASKGTLTNVSIKLDAYVEGKVVVWNLTPVAKTGTVALDVLLGFGTGAVAQTFYTGTLYNEAYSLNALGKKTLLNNGTISASTDFSTGLGYFTASTVTGTAGVKAISSTTGGEGVVTTFTTKVLPAGTVTYTFNAAPVPEPETYGMLLVGLGLMGLVARRRAAGQA
ncbi:MAG: PEP-CTERM sorting domain-containing protein, partial [Burkholderiaceae bacterium]|nr:PEP-CTERM sorting domain-containing protein [Burkholderiaceae bacterium]